MTRDPRPKKWRREAPFLRGELKVKLVVYTRKVSPNSVPHFKRETFLKLCRLHLDKK